MRNLVLVLAATTAMAGTAQATTVYSNNFDGENGGTTSLNYNGFNGLTVTGKVDLTRNGDFYACAGGSGSCVDLDGTTGPGKLTSTSSYNFGANRRVTLTFDLAGNSRNASVDDFFAGFGFGTNSTAKNYTVTYNGVTTNYGTLSGISMTSLGTISGNSPFMKQSISFITGNSGSLNFFIGTHSKDNIGPVLDNLSLSISAVPEPATWALMILGFGAVGGAMRRRRTAGVATA